MAKPNSELSAFRTSALPMPMKSFCARKLSVTCARAATPISRNSTGRMISGSTHDTTRLRLVWSGKMMRNAPCIVFTSPRDDSSRVTRPTPPAASWVWRGMKPSEVSVSSCIWL